MKVITNINDQVVADALNNNQLAVFKSDTIYGIFAKANSPKAYQNLTRVRPKSRGKYYIVLISSLDDAKSIGINEEALNLISNFWPGPVTVALKLEDPNYNYLANDDGQIAIRMPDDENLLSLIKKSGPLLAPSCNPEGSIPASNINQAIDYFGDRVLIYVDAGEVLLDQPPSTVLGLDGKNLTVFREGALPIRELKKQIKGLSLINLPYKKRKLHKFGIFENNQNCFENKDFKFSKLASKSQTVNLELAAGSADLSLGLAQRNPDQQFIAIDIKADRLASGASKASRLKLNNLKFLRTNIVDLLELIPANSIDKIWITFPDPMPKKRQQKHRLVGRNFLSIYKKILKSDGRVLFKTDDINLFHFGLEQIVKHGGKILSLSFDLHSSALPDDYKITTTYERKFLAEGKTVNFVEFGL